MPIFQYASFPNSRIKPRTSTQEANTYRVAVLDYTQPLTLIAAADLNRTYIILKNLSSVAGFLYVYAAPVTSNPTLVPTAGVPFELVLFGTQLYQKQDNGETTNWNPVSIQNVGQLVDQLQSATLEEIQLNIYAAANSNVPVVPQVEIAVDAGRG